MPLTYWFRTLFVAVVTVAIPLSANPIHVYGTGLDDAMVLLPGGSPDPHYDLVTSPDAIYPGPAALVAADGYPVGAGIWVDNGPNSKWISPRADASSGNSDGDYLFQTTFSLEGLDPATAILHGAWAADNAGLEIYLNGLPTGNSIPYGTPGSYSFQQLSSFTISTGFMAGANTLAFRLNNFPNGGVNPAGLRVDLSGTADPTLPTAIPEPSSIGLFVDGGILLILARIRRG